MDDGQAREAVARVEALLARVEGLEDLRARDTALEMVQELLALYGEGLARVVGRVPEPRALAEDELVTHLLLIHGLHPVPVEERVLGALDEVRPYLDSHGGAVELLGVDDNGIVRLALRGSCEGCPSSAMTLKLAIEEAVLKAAPEVERVEAEGAVASRPPGIPLPLVRVPARGTEPTPKTDADDAWAVAGSLPQLSGGGTVVSVVAGEPVLFLRLDGTPYAYRPTCPGCLESLEGAPLEEGGELTCPTCGHAYDARRAGRCLDAPALHLEPIPLLVADSGVVKVALAAGVA